MFKIFFSFIFCFYTPLALTKMHIEPYIGYSFTALGKKNFSKDFFNAQGIDNKAEQAITELGSKKFYQGISPGMRLGYSSLGFAVGVDFSWGYWKSVFSGRGASIKDRQTIIPFLPGLFASYKLPLLFRAYAGIIPQSIIQIKSGGEDLCSKGTARGGKIGISYLSLPFLSVNFEYLPLYISGCPHVWSHTGTVSANIIF